VDGPEPGWDLLAYVFGVRALAISTFGVLARSDRTVRYGDVDPYRVRRG